MTFSIDMGSGKPTSIQDLVPANSTTDLASSIAATSPLKYVFSVSNDANGVNAYSVGSNGTLTLVSGSPFPLPSVLDGWPYIGALAINPTNSSLYAVDSGWDLLAEFQIDSTTGALTASPTGFYPLQSAVAAPQTEVVAPSGQFLYTTDYYTGTFDSSANEYAGISAFSVNSSGSLSLIPGSPFLLPTGSQPQQVVMTPSGDFVYAALFNSSSTAGFSVNSETGVLTPIAGSPFDNGSSSFTEASSLAMHPSGKFLYAFNLNGHNISAFAIDSSSGVLTPIAGSPFAGQNSIYYQNGTVATQGPIAIDPSGSFLYVVCFDEELAIYRIDQSTGALSVAGGSPVAIPKALLSVTVGQAP
ncbi:MAG: beta-propeller fold lactonase family protein [Terracidiphilus sp.]